MTTQKFFKYPIDSRKNVVFLFAKYVSILGYKFFTRAYEEIPDDLLRLKKEENSVFIYASLHKSLWEATGIIVSLYLNDLPIVYAGMGDNLVRGKFFQSLAKKAGVFLIKRPTNRSEMLESAKSLKSQLINFMMHGKDVLFFPEGTRKSILSQGEYGKFFPTAFEAVLEYEKNKAELSHLYPDTPLYNTYIVPTNVDYSKIREDLEMLEDFKGKPRTLRLWDSLKMLKNIRETYVSCGQPIRVAECQDIGRKELATLCREKCLELVKILPINLVSRAVLDSVDGDRIDQSRIEENIGRNIEKLSHLKDRFRGFSSDDSPASILARVRSSEKYFRKEFLSIQSLDFYRLYANYINHYFESHP
ncbi:MAG: 1-acyl-sn-glycerol-3-phosphate acyltransferase [Candidatus Omnitrophota bacterium]